MRRKVREEFRKNAGLAGEEAAAAIAKAKAERALIDRQVAVYDMFGSKTPSVIDFAKAKKWRASRPLASREATTTRDIRRALF